MLRFLKKEMIVAKGPIFPIELKKDKEEKQPRVKICDLSIHFEQVDSSTQALIIGKQTQAKFDVQKKMALVIYLLRNVINQVVIEDETGAEDIFKRISDDDEKTLRYLSEQVDMSHDPSVAVFFGIAQLVIDNIIMPQDVKKKSGQLELPTEEAKDSAEDAPTAKEDGQQASVKG